MVSSLFLVLAFFLACLFGASTDEWSWGPAMLSLAVSLAAAVVVLPPRKTRVRIPVLVWVMVVAALIYMAVRAWLSPVRGLAVADLMLLGLCGGSFLVVALQGSNRRFVTVLAFGLGLLVMANAVVALIQLRDPGFTVFGGLRMSDQPSGLFPHYNYFANFQLGVGLWLAGMALIGGDRRARWMRVAFGVAGALALFSVPVSQSRGGVIAMGVGLVVLVALTVWIASRGKGRAGAWLMLAAPLVIVMVVFGSVKMLGRVQGQRKAGTGVEETLSEAGRLQYAQKAFECALTHPFFGGGSRSVSWENYRYWNKETNGYIGEDLVFAHNEPVQALTDYGVAGFLLVLIPVATLLTIGVVRLSGGSSRSGNGNQTGVIIGCLAGSVAMLAQCQGSFVFHLAPGAMLLGGFMGMLAGAGAPLEKKSPEGLFPVARAVRAGALLLAVAMVWPGVKATRALRAFAGMESGPSRQEPIDAAVARARVFEKATSVWGTPDLFLSLGRSWFNAAMIEKDPELRADRFARSVEADATAARLHPYDPQIAVNYALALSWSGRDADADREFRRALELQHGVEGAFQVQYNYGTALYRKGWKLAVEKQYEPAAEVLKRAGDLIDGAMRDNYRVRTEGRKLRIQISKVLAEVYLKLGREDDALKAWKYAASIPGGRSVHYYMAVEMLQRGRKNYESRNPEKALRWFTDALAELKRTGGKYPDGVDSEAAAELRKQLEASIKFLKGAHIQLPPAESE
jgi:tetratricopeptide (TPR) repeat protein